MWDWRLYLIKEDGSLWPLRALDQSAGAESGALVPRSYFQFVPGAELSRKAVFLAPPGKRNYRLLVEAYLKLSAYDSVGLTTRAIPVATYSEDLSLDLKPHGRTNISRSYKPGQDQ
jgi:hypothetical protein